MEDGKEITHYIQRPVCIFIVLEQVLLLLCSVILVEEIIDDILHKDKMQVLKQFEILWFPLWFHTKS